MKYAYPALHLQHGVNRQLAIRIARHSSCRLCDCLGLRPPAHVEVVLDTATSFNPQSHSLGLLGQYGSDDDESALEYLNICECGHGVAPHSADEPAIGRSEYLRRGRVATRLDELLQDAGKLLDFEYTDEDIISLRKQMRDPVSLTNPHVQTEEVPYNPPLSPVSSESSDVPRPTKKQRFSSLSDADDHAVSVADDEDAPNEEEEEEEEEEPLRSPHRSSRAGKKSAPGLSLAPSSLVRTPHISSKSRVLPIDGSTQKTVNGKVNGALNGQHESKVKEEQLDEGQLKRLATGVTVDSAGTGVASIGPLGKPEKVATIELRKGYIKITAVENDKEPRSVIILTGLKTLFQKQLPKMPREYIARLVYDSNSKALAIIKRGFKVVGGICYRPFPHRGFAEIVFFATNSADQEKGYGGMLMDHFKAHIRSVYPTMMHLLTYADNYAVGYFEKQGFSKEITLDRSVWAGYIKDYEGGTIMQCTLLNKVDYLDKAKVLLAQQEAVMTKIRAMSKSHIVHPGLTTWRMRGDEDDAETMDVKDIPGLRESGWLPALQANVVRPSPKSADQLFMERVLKELQNHPQAWPFLNPVSAEDVADYYEVIKSPMDLKTMEHKLDTERYPSLDDFVKDAHLVFENCRVYNQEGSIYARNANKLEKHLNDLLNERIKKED
ncbi:hypothetical protein M378DRAFT_10508 [Amanita muscaria Koide BX008]|uniref:histone acetyltransferase n=1 Tax=Amanita muscaria (strain Koide BX008) TaxID=946122 RepID=A0A0C2WVW6_AMAMK|nr:hypothetical protein M378DRAFT_10508 [Amanita muscaria Koide BX008]